MDRTIRAYLVDQRATEIIPFKIKKITDLVSSSITEIYVWVLNKE